MLCFSRLWVDICKLLLKEIEVLGCVCVQVGIWLVAFVLIAVFY